MVPALRQQLLEGYFTPISTKFSEEITDLDAYFRQVRRVWSHAPYRGALSDAVYERCGAVFYVVRDPPDALLSLADFAFSRYGRTYLKLAVPERDSFIEERSKSYPKRWANYFGAHLGLPADLNVTLVQYEPLSADLSAELMRMAKAMGLYG